MYMTLLNKAKTSITCVGKTSVEKVMDFWDLNTNTDLDRNHTCSERTMKQVIGLVLLGLFCSNAVLVDANDETHTDGVSQSGRIVNGVGMNIASNKFLMSLWLGRQYACGASIITPSHALTAGHCAYDVRNIPNMITLYGGSTSPYTGGFTIPVITIVVHPNYNPNAATGTSDFDVAVLTVPRNAFVGKPNMAPIVLEGAELPAGTLCYVVGWGRTNINGPAPTSRLRLAYMYIVSQGTCAASWTPSAQPITSNMICAKYRNGVDVCEGDSGGALVCGRRLSGIVSFTNPDCNGALPAGFAKISAPSIRSFIRNQTGIQY
ncbi:trypsin 3A1-like isoform X3 [Anopheles funestus]|uniref:trypsin-delta-like n=1 Tax=Anopheles funestus TaxID=62324 RepID=UPI0020C70814|nr:trypsin-delta-like [Anopheles funestus]